MNKHCREEKKKKAAIEQKTQMCKVKFSDPSKCISCLSREEGVWKRNTCRVCTECAAGPTWSKGHQPHCMVQAPTIPSSLSSACFLTCKRCRYPWLSSPIQLFFSQFDRGAPYVLNSFVTPPHAYWYSFTLNAKL